MKAEIIQRLKQGGWPEKNYEQVAHWLMQATTQQQLVQWLDELLIERKPLAYVLGYVPFCSLRIAVEPPVLIPRPETEEWVARLIEQVCTFGQPLRILDLCSGSGCIALALAHALPNSTVLGLDIAPHAVALAQRNQQALGLSNVSFMQSDLFNAVTGQYFDLIVANPPYVSDAEWQTLDAIVRDWEDPHALVAPQDGLALLYLIIQQATHHLTTTWHGPQLVLEMGCRQAAAVCTKLAACGYNGVVERDLAGLDRVVVARCKKGSTCRVRGT